MRRVLVVVVSAMLFAVAPLSAGAITGGQIDTANRYPFVGLLAFYDANGDYAWRCTGTLVTPTVVLTAAHCTDGATSAYAYFEVVVPDDFRENPTGVAGTPHTNPNYNPNTLANDTGVVILGDGVRLGTYPTIAGEGLLTKLKADHEIQDDTFVAVGYGGVPQFPPNIIEYDLKRRFAESPYGGLNQQKLHLLQNPNPAGAGGTCFGDSGGPHFWNDTLVIASVTSWGDAICRSNDMTQRVDIPTVLGFLAEWGVTPA
jgi:secreted trypsin-like serine protease